MSHITTPRPCYLQAHLDHRRALYADYKQRRAAREEQLVAAQLAMEQFAKDKADVLEAVEFKLEKISARWLLDQHRADIWQHVTEQPPR